MPRSGDMTMAMRLWNAGTEAEQAPGAGADQAPRQSGANMGAAENGVIEQVDDAAWPSADMVVRVTLTPAS